MQQLLRRAERSFLPRAARGGRTRASARACGCWSRRRRGRLRLLGVPARIEKVRPCRPARPVNLASSLCPSDTAPRPCPGTVQCDNVRDTKSGATPSLPSPPPSAKALQVASAFRAHRRQVQDSARAPVLGVLDRPRHDGSCLESHSDKPGQAIRSCLRESVTVSWLVNVPAARGMIDGCSALSSCA